MIAGGTRVVLPAPGSATRTSDPCPRSFSSTSGSTESIGNAITTIEDDRPRMKRKGPDNTLGVFACFRRSREDLLRATTPEAKDRRACRENSERAGLGGEPTGDDFQSAE